MANNTSLRFAVADSELRSEVWSLFLNDSDVYLTSHVAKNDYKISLHASGVCQIALLSDFYNQHLSWREVRPESRTILRWRRIPTPDYKGQVALSILFASFETWPAIKLPTPSKSFISLPPPPDMQAIIVDTVYSRVDPVIVSKLGGWADQLLFSTKLPSQEYVCLSKRIELLPEDFFDFAVIESPYLVTRGMEDNEMDDVRGVSAFDCAQIFDGHGAVRSLHNMRLKSIEKE